MMNRVAINILLSLLSMVTHGQVVKSTNLDLNAGGVVYDMVEAPAQDCYVIVGDFSSVGGQPRQNIAFIDRSTLNVSSDYVPISSIDGEVRTVVSHLGSIYIGGTFSSVNGVARNGAARLGIQSGGSPALVASWDPDLHPSIVNDMMLYQFRIIVAGEFNFVDFNGNPQQRPGYASLHPASASVNSFGATIPLPQNGFRINRIDTVEGNFFISGRQIPGAPLNETFAKLTSAGDIDPTFNPVDNGEVEAYSFAGDSDGNLHLIDRYASSIEQLVLDPITGADQPLSPTYPIGYVNSGTPRGLLTYKDDLIRSFEGSNFSQLYALDLDDPNNPLWSISTQYFSSAEFKNLWRFDNKLFISNPTMSSVDGHPRQGLAILCLEPFDPGDITGDPTVCPGQTLSYSINPIDNADGYQWSYSGNGANFTGQSNAILIEWMSNFSPGTLTVRPFTNCDGTLIFSEDSSSMPIGMNPLPHVDAGEDSTLTCKRDSLLLIGQSVSQIAAIQWEEYAPGDTIPSFVYYDDSASIENPGNYVCVVEDQLGCENRDTVLITMDTIRPNVNAPLGPFVITCAVDTLTINGGSTSSNTELTWRSLSTGNLYSNPLETDQIGLYNLRSIDTLNGCGDSLQIEVTIDQQPPDIEIAGHPNYLPWEHIDTLDCSTGTLLFQTSVPAPFGTQLTVHSGGTYWLYATDTSNGCSDSLSFQVFEDTIDYTPTDSIAVFAPCDSSTSGQIVVNLNSGRPPFSFSIDGSNYQSNPVFTGLSTGTYDIEVIDSAGCSYLFTETINSSSSTPHIDFLMPTYNMLTDTIVMVDVSITQPDSVEWQFPPEVIVLDSSALSPVVLPQDTGTYGIIMTAFLGSCVLPVTKDLHVSPYDSTLANLYNHNGIDTILVFPNPSSGPITIEVLFHKSQRATIHVIDQSGVTHFEETTPETDHYTLQVDLTGLQGVFVVKVVSEFDSGHLILMLQ